MSATVRKTKGQAIDAACGQLRRRFESAAVGGTGLDFGRGFLIFPAYFALGAVLVSRGELDALERQLESRDPDVRLMLQIRDDMPGAFEVMVSRVSGPAGRRPLPHGRQP